MRTICFIFVFLLSCKLSIGQSFVDNKNIWNVKEGYYNSSVTFIYHYDGDSLFNDILYKKMYYWFDSTFSERYFAGLLREEEPKVWYVPPYVDQEGLLYDFSLNVGDTVDVISMFCWEYPEYGLVCQAMDSIQLETGEYRKRWIFEGWSEEIWVEGVGSLYGPVHSRVYNCIFDYYVELLCLYHDDILLYSNPWFEFCYINTLSIPEVETAIPVHISPNPVKAGGRIKINADFVIDRLEVYTSHGVLKRQIAGFEMRNELFETGRLSPGLYLIRVIGRNGEMGAAKLMIF